MISGSGSSDIDSGSSETNPKSGESVIEARSLSKKYGSITALDGVSLVVAAGEIVAIVGDNGAGKSTLVRILSGATKADSGEILLDGRSIELSSPLDARELGIEPFTRISGRPQTVMPRQICSLDAEALLRQRFTSTSGTQNAEMRLRTQEFLSSLQVNVPRETGIPVVRMSGGQRQSVAIARGCVLGGSGHVHG